MDVGCRCRSRRALGGRRWLSGCQTPCQVAATPPRQQQQIFSQKRIKTNREINEEHEARLWSERSTQKWSERLFHVQRDPSFISAIDRRRCNHPPSLMTAAPFRRLNPRGSFHHVPLFSCCSFHFRRSRNIRKAAVNETPL
ncbi:hypothetical protein JOB18_013139 [Solea senegalensis]|uniref:Uncharacterized protein n=1 Tax=Solea senegalensis TaxID=28829 RepID=A0AAV6SMJ3_SOLSE|nr:hypothetical protein JOB18_013139 [Solea senegalensis]